MQNAIPNENLPVDGAAARGRARSIPAPLLHAGGLLAVALFAVAIRLIPASVEWISNDAVEYRDAGRRLAEGKGFTLSIKAYHFVRTPLEHYAGYDRPPLYPMALAALRRLSADPRAPAWLNMAFAALAAMLVALLGARLDSRAAGYWAALLAGAAPALVRSSYYAWSEPLALLLALGAIWIFLGAERPGRLGWMPLAGALCGLAFLARPALFYVPVSLAAYVAVAPGWSSVRRFGGFCSLCGGFAFFLAPLVILNVSHGAAPWTTAQAYIYRSLRFADGMYFGWGKAWESSVFDVVKEHPREIGLEIYRHGRDYAKALFLGGGWLGVYSIALPFLLWRDAQRGLPHGQTLLLGLALAGLAFHTLTWPTKDADRFLQLPFVALLILAVGQVQAFAREWQKRLAGRARPARAALRWLPAAAALATLLAFYLPPTVGDAREARRRAATEWPMMGIFSANWKNPDALAFHAWVREHSAPGAYWASTNPWAIARHAERPAALLPFDLSEPALRRFIEELSVDYIALNPEHPHPVYGREADYGAMLEAMEGAARLDIGSYRIYDLTRIAPLAAEAPPGEPLEEPLEEPPTPTDGAGA